jgi:hypothetical protein
MRKSKDGNLITGKTKILEKWMEHFDELLNYADKENGQEVVIERINPPEELYDLGMSELEMEEPSLDEVQMRNYKATGPDSIQVGLIKCGGESLKTYIHQLIGTIWKEKIVPGD